MNKLGAWSCTLLWRLTSITCYSQWRIYAYRPWPRAPRFCRPRAILSFLWCFCLLAESYETINHWPYDNSKLTKNFTKLRRSITSQFTLKRAEMQMSTLDSYQYSNNTTIWHIWTWHAGILNESGYKKRMKKKNSGSLLSWCFIFHWQKAVLDPTSGCFYKISRKQIEAL